MMNLRSQSLSPFAILLFCGVLGAEEGMWTFDNPPVKQLQQSYGFTPGSEWLDHLRLATARVGGGTGSFVSRYGLLLTNHHIARSQLQKMSTAEHDYLRTGYYAATAEQEMKCPDLELIVLQSMENVTGKIQAALKGAGSDAEQFRARRATIAGISRESEKTTGLQSDVVTLYDGGEYWLYRYKKYTDVRLVFAPEQQIAFFGGDPDNFVYPRYDFDIALFRVYENGKPIETREYLKWHPAGAADGELVFVPGHPGSTERLYTVAQLEHLRDETLPGRMKRTNHDLSVLREYSAQGAEQARQAGSAIFGDENFLKSDQGLLSGLLNPQTMGIKKKAEENFRARVRSNAQWQSEFGGAWDLMAEAMRNANQRPKEEFRSLGRSLPALATAIVEYVSEIKKPDGDRLAGYHESQLNSLRIRLFSPAPIYPAMEIARMAGALQLAVQELGPDDPYVKIALDGKTPEHAAEQWMNGTKLTDPAVRRQLIDGGEAAVAASADSMIVLARRLDPVVRESIRWEEENVRSLEQRAGEGLGKARFAVYGRTTYPDATFTLRLSYGQVKGYPMNGSKAPSKTTFYGLYDRANSFDFKGPFALPERYVAGREKLNLATPLNFVTTNDTTGGNSGSPIVNRNGEIVGLIFDGNIESLVGDVIYDETTNRTVAVTTNAITEALPKLYGAGRLMDEIMQ